MNRQNARRFVSAASVLAMLLLTSCAAPLTPSTGVTYPPPEAIPDLSPSLKVPPPQESFLEAATKLSSGWLQKLTDSATR